MATFADKWKILTRAFQSAISGETLWSKNIQNVNYGMETIAKNLDDTEVNLSCSLNASKGKTHQQAPGFLAQFQQLTNQLKNGTHKNAVLGELNNTDKNAKPKTYRALKVLATGIDDIMGLADYKHRAFVTQVATIGQQLSAQQRIAQVQALAMAQVKKAVMKSLSEIQKVKATPTQATWTEFLNAGGTRDLCMALVTLLQAQGQGQFGNVPNATAHKNATAPWNTQQPNSKLQPTDGAPQITAKVKQWSVIVKAVANDYQAHW